MTAAACNAKREGDVLKVVRDAGRLRQEWLGVRGGEDQRGQTVQRLRSEGS
jgi:hypothetical protein